MLSGSIRAIALVEAIMDQIVKQVQICTVEFWKCVYVRESAEYFSINFSTLFQSAGNPWEAPLNWKTLHPSLNLDLDDETPYVVHNGAVHVTTQVSDTTTAHFFLRLFEASLIIQLEGASHLRLFYFRVH